MKLFKQALKNLITEKMSNSKTIFKTLFLIFSLAILTTSCKKDKVNPNVDPNLVGTWSNVRQVGTFLNIVTNLELKENGSGNELVTSVTTSSSNTTSDKDFDWKSEISNSKLVFKYNNGETDTFSYVIDQSETVLTLTSTTNVNREFFKLE